APLEKRFLPKIVSASTWKNFSDLACFLPDRARPDLRAFSRISLPLSVEDGKGNLSWHVFLSGEATYARTEGKDNPVRKVLKQLFSHSQQKVEMMQGQP